MDLQVVILGFICYTQIVILVLDLLFTDASSESNFWGFFYTQMHLQILGAILRSYVNVNVPDFFKDLGGCTHFLHAFATREFRKNLTIFETSSSRF